MYVNGWQLVVRGPYPAIVPFLVGRRYLFKLKTLKIEMKNNLIKC